MSASAANSTIIKILGAVFVVISGVNARIGEEKETRHVAEGTRQL